mgnify:CR=1 FL=1
MCLSTCLPYLPKLHHIQHRIHHPNHRAMPTLMNVPVEPIYQEVGIVAQAVILKSLLPNNHLGIDGYTFQFPLTSADVVMLGKAVIQKVGYVFLDDAALFVHRIS